MGAPPAPVESIGLSKGLAKLIGSPSFRAKGSVPMRLVSFRHAGASKFGAVVEGGIVDLSARTQGRWSGLREVIAAKALAELAALAKVRAPISSSPMSSCCR